MCFVTLPAVPQPGRNAVDAELDALHHAGVGVAGAVAAQQFDLHVVQRIDVGHPAAQRASEQRISFQKLLLACDSAHGIDGRLPLGFQPFEDRAAQRLIANQLGVARGDGDIALGQQCPKFVI